MLEALEVAAVPPCFMCKSPCKYSLLLEVECKSKIDAVLCAKRGRLSIPAF